MNPRPMFRPPCIVECELRPPRGFVVFKAPRSLYFQYTSTYFFSSAL